MTPQAVWSYQLTRDQTMKTILLGCLLLTHWVHGAVPINPGMAGTWHDASKPGQGLFIDVIPANNTLFAGWFTYLPNQSTAPNQYWLTLQGPYSGSVAELTIYQTDQGQFNTTTDVLQVSVGLATLSFTNCTSAQFNFQLDPFGINDTIELTRVTPDVSCQDHVNNNPPTAKTLNYPPQVNHLEISHQGDAIDMQFDLFDPEDDLLDIQFVAINAAGDQYAIPEAYLHGHVGFPVLAGQGKQVSWNHLDDQGFQALNYDQVKIHMVADDRQFTTMQAIVDAVSEERLIDDIRAIEGVRHFLAYPAGLTTTRNHIRTEMNALPVQVEEQNFIHQGSTGINLITTLPASRPTQDVYIIDGHYDTVGGTPGADDNATGTAGMLEAMRVLSQFNSQKNLKFIGFDKEELGLRGSRFYATNVDSSDNILGLINFEMIGYTCSGQAECINFPNADTSIYNIKSSFANTLSDTFNQIGSVHVPGLKITAVTDDGDPNFRRSDHAPFWDIGVDALFLTDGANFRTPHYHQSTDRLATLDTEFMTQVVKTAVGTLATLAEVTHTGQATSEPLNLNPQ